MLLCRRLCVVVPLRCLRHILGTALLAVTVCVYVCIWQMVDCFPSFMVEPSSIDDATDCGARSQFSSGCSDGPSGVSHSLIFVSVSTYFALTLSTGGTF